MRSKIQGDIGDSDKDRLDGAGDKISGNAKEGIGTLTGDDQTEAEGKAEQVTGDIKPGIADVKDEVSDFVKKATD
jgi:uncharacterized protein YjbJ (UPF0337 family)